MNRVPHKTDELVQIYRYSQQGWNARQIADETKISYSSVASALHRLDLYISGKVKSKTRHAQSYKAAARLIRKERREAPTQEPKHNGDNFAFLRRAFDKFQQATSAFLEVEINTRFEALRTENQQLREENEQLKKQVEGLRTNNWVDALENKLPRTGELL